ncbi:MAG: phosphatase PAP2 family protein [Catenulisporales bacterium]|nr:phosphatase PAP2 family protein [Catenulisporales bacterium]
MLSVAAVFAVLVVMGWLVTGPLAHTWPISAEDAVNRGLAAHRNQRLNNVSGFFSTLADTPSAIALSGVAFLVIRLLTHRWRPAVFVAAALICEVGVFLLTTLVIDRGRPAVVRLDAAPPTSSFPSGHVAAAVALYGAIALVARRSGAPWAVWLVLLIPCAVGFARLYRGMHHPSDVVAGAVLGALCLVLAHHFVLRKPETVPTGRRLNPAPSRRSRTSRRPESRPPARPRRAAPGRR